ncbi:MAG: hypothetical protein GWN46_22730, partial [Gammaproteobacteria bacterium]|nr:hypothetical protein [Gammaproteobacteria bacterium]
MEEAWGAPIVAERYRRVVGLDPQMEGLVAAWEASGEAPPYLDIDPVDLEIRMFGNAALATFHLGGDEEDGV